MRALLRSIVLTVFGFITMSALAEEEPKIFWGQPVHEWSLGISTTNAVFPEGVPPYISLYLSNGANVTRVNTITPDFYDFKIVWATDSGDILEQKHPDSILQRGGSLRTYTIGIRETVKVRALCEDLLARLPPGQGRLIAMRNLKLKNGWEKLNSADLPLRVRPRVESDPPPIPVQPTDREIIAEGYVRRRAARDASNAAASNLFPRQTSPHIPATLNKSGTPSFGQKSVTPASPVIASVATGDPPGSIFTPRNIIGATVVLGLLAIIASVLLRARSRQNPPP